MVVAVVVLVLFIVSCRYSIKYEHSVTLNLKEVDDKKIHFCLRWFQTVYADFSDREVCDYGGIC